MNITDYRRQVDRALANYRAARALAHSVKHQRDATTSSCASYASAAALTASVAQQVQSTAHARIATLVTQCLSIFDEPYSFRIDFARARGKTEARLVFERDGLEVDPLTASGGGVVDVAAFALRVSCLLLSKPPLARVLVLDEPFRFVSPQYRPRLRALIEELAKTLKIQFIMVTHDPALQTGKIVELD